MTISALGEDTNENKRIRKIHLMKISALGKDT
jgi:hypothetical protein